MCGDKYMWENCSSSTLIIKVTFKSCMQMYIFEHDLCTIAYHKYGMMMKMCLNIFSQSLFQRKEERKDSRFHVVVVQKINDNNVYHNLFTIQANFVKLSTLAPHHKDYNLSKGHNSVMLFDQIMPLYELGNNRRSLVSIS